MDPKNTGRHGGRSLGAAIAIAVVLTSLQPAARPERAAAATASVPNVLIVLTDDQAASGTLRVMPHVARWLGHDGRTYPNAFATTPLCCPSRTTILTGRYAHNHGIVDNAASDRTIFDPEATVLRYLQDAGYRTGFFGKLFNFWKVDDDPPYLDRWAIISPSRSSNGYLGGTWNVQGDVRTVERYSTDYIAEQGARFIWASEADDDRPWFLELSTYAPHLKAIPPERYEDADVGRFHSSPAVTESDRSDKPPFIQALSAGERGLETALERQLRTLLAVDDLVAKITDTLKDTDETRDTLVFFLSDNGFLLGDHGIRGKGYPYDRGLRVPLLVRWPAAIDAGTIDQRLVANVDIAPTIMDAAGLSPDSDRPMDGRSLLDRSWTRDRLLLEAWPWTGSSAVQWASTWSRGYEYTEYYAEDGSVAFREYYDLGADPWQLVNLLHDGKAENDPDVSALHAQLSADRTCIGDGCP
jgi:arylsulfatase A-like enzyme